MLAATLALVMFLKKEKQLPAMPIMFTLEKPVAGLILIFGRIYEITNMITVTLPILPIIMIFIPVCGWDTIGESPANGITDWGLM